MPCCRIVAWNLVVDDIGLRATVCLEQVVIPHKTPIEIIGPFDKFIGRKMILVQTVFGGRVG